MYNQDLDFVINTIDTVANEEEWTFYSSDFYEKIRLLVAAAVYEYPDILHVSTRDDKTNCTYIIAKSRCSIITDSRSSWCRPYLWGYENLTVGELVRIIFEGLQEAFLRLE